jgi:hypothetical protein
MAATLQITKAFCDSVGHLKNRITSRNQMVDVVFAIENPIVAIETRTAPVGVLYVHEQFRYSIAVKIMQFKFHIAPIANRLLRSATGRANILHDPSDDLGWQAAWFG